ncbi:MAG: hypothetical protein IPK82_22830 [Polyangiaceae bacterium]|nr:hypothetical protein [Polyangiaceae bacterium]
MRKRMYAGTSSLLLVITAVQTIGPQKAAAYPGEVFQSAAPATAPDSPTLAGKKAEPGHRISDAGAVEYTIALPVAPNRQNMVPDLALRYSSRNPLRGGVAAGWQLDLPIIERDRSKGITQAPEYRSSMSRGMLVRVGPASDPNPFPIPPVVSEEFRAEEDDSFTKYVRVTTSTSTTNSSGSVVFQQTSVWYAYTTDGRVYEFGTAGPDGTLAQDIKGASAAPGSSDARYFLRKITDRFGNEIVFNYGRSYANVAGDRFIGEPVDLRLDSVEYGKNANAGLEHHARLVLEHGEYADTCADSRVPIGALFDYRAGFPLYKGAQRLNRVRLEVKDGANWVERRTLDLAYDMSELTCQITGKAHAPLRFLTSITETAVSPEGVTTTAPPLTFTYGRKERTFDQAIPTGVAKALGAGQTPRSYDKSGGWPTLETMLLDLDGDAKLDLLKAHRNTYGGLPAPDPNFCQAAWEKKSASGYSPAALFGTILTAPNGQPTPNAVFPVVPWADGGYNTGVAGLEDREGCSLSAQFSRVDHYAELPTNERCGLSSTYLSYRFMDMDGDNLPDLVTGIDTNRGAYRPEDDSRIQPKVTSCTDNGACRDPSNNPALCKVVSPLPAALYFEPGSGTIECPGNLGCRTSECIGDEVACCNPILCNENVGPMAHLQSPPVDSPDPEGPGWGEPSGDAPMSRWHDGAGISNGPVGAEQTYVHVPSPKCLIWPEMECNRYVLRVHKNLGGGQFSSAVQLVMSPVPLESDRPTSNLGGGALAASSSWHGFVDLDGDGVLDAVHMEPFFFGSQTDYPTSPTHFSMFQGNPNGSFNSDPAGGGFHWAAPRIWEGSFAGAPAMARARVHVRDSESIGGWVNSSRESITIRDMNGDGLPDYLDTRHFYGDTPTQKMRVFLNTGRGFESNATWTGYEGVNFNPDAGAAGFKFERTQDWAHDRYDGNENRRGYSRYTHRLMDVDSDGLVDLVVLPDIEPGHSNPWMPGTTIAPLIYLNVGDTLVYAGSNPAWNKVWAAVGRITLNSQGKWVVTSDIVDLDGDGLSDAITNDDLAQNCTFDAVNGQWPALCVGENNGWTDTGGPMRLLSQVDNGRGGTVTFNYAPMQVTTGRVPYPVWVATGLTANSGPDAVGNPSAPSVTQYAYDQPAYNTDLRGEWGFRGFGKTTVTAPSGSKVITTRSFSPYYGGLVTDVRVVEAGGHVSTIEQNTWEQRTVFDTDGQPGTVKTQHMTVKDTRTCGASQTENQCATAGALRRDAYTLYPLVTETDSTPQGYFAYQVVSGPGAYGNVGSTYSAFWDQLYSSGSNYWILRKSEWSGKFTAPWVSGPVSQTSHYFSGDKKTELWTSRSMGTTWAVTSHAYDNTGNKTLEQTPNHYGTQKGVVYAYDANKRFVTQTTNEIGFTNVTVTDPATGAVLEERGTNLKNGVRDGVIRTVDGFGRTLSESVMIDNAAGGYTPVQVLTNEYYDLPSPTPKVITRRRVELDENRWTESVNEVDGFGRTQNAMTLGPAGWATTSFFRDASGNTTRIRAPRADATSFNDTVDWTFGYDSLGRLVGTAEPSRQDCAEYSPSALTWCGTKTTYDGRTVLTERVTGTLSGPLVGAPSKSKATLNALGQTVLVEEWTSAGSWVPTTYAYDGRNNVEQIVNADGVVTTMTHDLLSRRTSVARGGKVWSYEYDANGNMTKIIAPVPAGGVAVDYTTLITYDDLNRETTRTVGKGGLASTEISTFGTGTTLRVYDQNPNGVGRLSVVAWSHGNTSYEYDSRGNTTKQTDSYSILGGAFADSLVTERTYNAQGQPSTSTAVDGNAFSVDYDTRGLPTALHWSGDAVYPVTELNHSLSGRLLERSRNSAGGQKMWEGFWYDVLGRQVSYATMSRLPGSNAYTTRASGDVAFTGTGEVYQMDTTIASSANEDAASALYNYDAQGRLTSATDAHGYQGTFTYSPGGRILAAAVNADATAERVHNRNVTYTYGANGADPDAPTALNTVGGGAWMEVDYDAAGNAVNRELTGQMFEHVYDGNNRQRAVRQVNPTGSADMYWYSGDGMRSLVVTTSSTGAVERVKWTSGDSEIWYDDAGDVTDSFAYASISGQSVRIKNGTALEHQINDVRGHLVASIADDGSLNAGFRYGPYGEILDEIGPASEDLLKRFNGKEYDETSGLSYYGYRYYDERSLVWTQADPLYRFVPDKGMYEPRKGNLYSFVLGNPVRLVDPDGREPESHYNMDITDALVHLVDPKGESMVADTARALGAVVLSPVIGVTALWEHGYNEVMEYGGAAVVDGAGDVVDGAGDVVGEVFAVRDKSLTESVQKELEHVRAEKKWLDSLLPRAPTEEELANDGVAEMVEPAPLKVEPRKKQQKKAKKEQTPSPPPQETKEAPKDEKQKEERERMKRDMIDM